MVEANVYHEHINIQDKSSSESEFSEVFVDIPWPVQKLTRTILIEDQEQHIWSDYTPVGKSICSCTNITRKKSRSAEDC